MTLLGNILRKVGCGISPGTPTMARIVHKVNKAVDYTKMSTENPLKKQGLFGRASKEIVTASGEIPVVLRKGAKKTERPGIKNPNVEKRNEYLSNIEALKQLINGAPSYARQLTDIAYSKIYGSTIDSVILNAINRKVFRRNIKKLKPMMSRQVKRLFDTYLVVKDALDRFDIEAGQIGERSEKIRRLKKLQTEARTNAPYKFDINTIAKEDLEMVIRENLKDVDSNIRSESEEEITKTIDAMKKSSDSDIGADYQAKLKQVIERLTKEQREQELHGTKQLFTRKEAEKFLEDFEKLKDTGNPREKALVKRIENASQEWTNATNQVLDILEKGKLLTRDEIRNIKDMHPNYFPRKIIDKYIDPATEHISGDKKISVRESGIQRQSIRGSDEALFLDSEALLGYMYNAAASRKFRNEANLEAVKLITHLKDTKAEANSIFKSLKDRITSAGHLVAPKTEPGMQQVAVRMPGKKKRSVFIEGELKRVWNKKKGKYIVKRTRGQWVEETMTDIKYIGIPERFHDSWVVRDPSFISAHANWVGWLSGSKPVKAAATGLNPFFLMVNLPIDIFHSWLVTGFRAKQGMPVYSTVPPVAAAQMTKDLASSFWDAVFRTGIAEKFSEIGGGTSFLTSQGAITSKTSGTMAAIQKMLAFPGETSELLPRLAVYKRFLRNQAKKLGYKSWDDVKVSGNFDARKIALTEKHAAFEARSYIDFTEGGRISKGLDLGLPYFNAAIQATRGVMRLATTDPKQFAEKMAYITSTMLGLYVASALISPKTTRDLSEDDATKFWVLPLGDIGSEKNKDGDVIYPYFKIPMEQSMRAFNALIQHAAAGLLGLPAPKSSIKRAIIDILPLSNYLPPSVEALIMLTTGWDMYREKKVWTGGEPMKGEYQYYDYTHPAFVAMGKTWFGDKVNWSPVLAESVIKEFTGQNNIFTYLAGSGWKHLVGTKSISDQGKVFSEVLRKNPFLRKYIAYTDTRGRAYESVSEQKRKSNDRRAGLTHIINEALNNENMTDQAKVDLFTRKLSDPSLQKGERDLLAASIIEAYTGVVDYPYKNFVKAVLAGARPDAKARIIYSQLKTMDSTEFEEYFDVLNSHKYIGTQIFTSEVLKEYYTLIRDLGSPELAKQATNELLINTRNYIKEVGNKRLTPLLSLVEKIINPGPEQASKD